MVVQHGAEVEQWGVFETHAVASHVPDNPFRDVAFGAEFRNDTKTITVSGFYDGEGTFRVRFSPDQPGRWAFRLRSSLAELDGGEGSFLCIPPGPDNHGPVRPHGLHFRYADGTPFFPMGTTAYVWTYQEDALVQSSLESFTRYGFNKIRMLLFPKEYGGGKDAFHISASPAVLPFEGLPRVLDFSRFRPEYFRHFEERVVQLLERGIQADVILFHPYDSTLWGIPRGMSPEDDAHYVRYVCARLSAFRNVWWSLANEYDLFGISLPSEISGLRQKDWKTIGELVAREDPMGHLRSIHNWPWGPVYPDQEWLTHVSYQHPNTWSLAIRLREIYRKPVIDDEYQYEGNLPNDFGNASAELAVKRHWMAFMAGAYATHGETFLWPGGEERLFWSTGGELVGDSPRRLLYVRHMMELVPFQDLEPSFRLSDGVDVFCLSTPDERWYVYFFSPDYKDRPSFHLGSRAHGGRRYELTIHDAWRCRVVDTCQSGEGSCRLARMPPWCVVVARQE